MTHLPSQVNLTTTTLGASWTTTTFLTGIPRHSWIHTWQPHCPSPVAAEEKTAKRPTCRTPDSRMRASWIPATITPRSSSCFARTACLDEIGAAS